MDVWSLRYPLTWNNLQSSKTSATKRSKWSYSTSTLCPWRPQVKRLSRKNKTVNSMVTTLDSMVANSTHPPTAHPSNSVLWISWKTLQSATEVVIHKPKGYISSSSLHKWASLSNFVFRESEIKFENLTMSNILIHYIFVWKCPMDQHTFKHTVHLVAY